MRKAFGVFAFVIAAAACVGVSPSVYAAAGSNTVAVMVLSSGRGAAPVPMGTYSNEDVAGLLRDKSRSVLSFPSVMGNNSSPLSVGITREVSLPGLVHPREVGMTVRVGFEQPDRPSLKFSNVVFEGFDKPHDGQPIFNIIRLSTSFSINPKSLHDDWYAFNLRKPSAIVSYDTLGKLQTPDDYPQLLLIRITHA